MARSDAKNAQSYQLPMGNVLLAGPGAAVLTQAIQRSSLMGCVQIASTDPLAEVNDITLSGQSLWVSSNPMGILAFAGNASAAEMRYVGIPIAAQSQVQISTTLAAGGRVGASITTDPVDDSVPIASIDEFGPRLNYCGGIFPTGGTVVGAGATAIVNTVIRRDVVLGRLVIYALDPATGLPSPVGTCTVDALSVNNLALQSGPANTPSPVESFSPQAFDGNGGNTMFFAAETNSVFSVTITNQSLANQTFFGGFWCLPPV